MCFEVGLSAFNLESISDKLKDAITETLKPDFEFEASEVKLEFKDEQVVLVTFSVDDADRLIDKIVGYQFKEKLNKKIDEDEEIPKQVDLKSVSSGTN